MKPNELRVGNYVYHKIDECDYVMTFELMKETFEVNEFDAYSPIALTEKWLVKFGFEPQIDLSSLIKEEIIDKPFFKDNFIVSIHKKFDGLLFRYNLDESIESSMGIMDAHHLSKLQYVHQLQNLCFALTGNEL